MNLDRPRFAYGPGQTTELILLVSATPYVRGLGPAVGGDIDGDSGIRASYVIYQLELLAFALRYHETEWPDIVNFIETVQDGQEFLFYPISDDDTVSFWVTLDSPAIGTAYSGQPDGTYPQVLSLAIVLATQDSFDELVPLPEALPPVGTPPEEPIDPTVATMTTVSDSVLHLSWTEVLNATGYTVVWHNGDGIFVPLPIVDNSILSYDFTGLPEGTVRFARVYAHRHFTVSSPSNIVNAKTLDDAPVDLAITDPSADNVHLAWTDSSAFEVGYQMQRSVDGGAFADLGAQLPAGTTTYIDLTADEGHSYTYRVAVIDDLARRNFSNLVTVEPIGTPTTSMLVLGASSLRASWSAVAIADHYRISWHNGDGIFTDLPDVLSGVLEYDFTGLGESVERYVKVRAIHSGLLGTYSNTATARTLPAAPVLSLTRVESNNAGLAWTDVSTHETGYQVQRSTDGGAWTNIGASLAPGTIIATDATAVDGHQYRYRIEVSDGFQTNLSNVVTADMYLVRTASGCLFRDNFNRVNGAAGANWSGGIIVGNQLEVSGANTFVTLLAAAMGGARINMHVQARIGRSANTVFAILLGRFISGNDYFQIDHRSGASGQALFKRVASAFTQIGVTGSIFAAVPPAFDLIALSMIGTDIRGWQNEVAGPSGSSGGSLNAAGVAGIQSFSGGTVYVDDFLVVTGRVITCPNLPAGYRLRIGNAGGILSDVSTGGGASVSLDSLGTQMPFPNIQVIDGSGNLVHKFTPTGTGCGDGVVGGDTLNWTGPVVPPPVEVEVGVGGLGPPGVYDSVTVGISPYYVGMNTAAPFENLMNSIPNRPDGKVDTSMSVDTTIIFSSAVSKVTITSYDAGNGTDNENWIIAYNAANVELGRTRFLLNGLTHRDTRSVEFPGIRKVVLQPGAGDWVAYEHLKFYH